VSRASRFRSRCAAVAACAAFGCIQIVQAPAPAPAPGTAEAPGEPESPASLFGIITTDAAGEPRFVETTSVPNVAGQSFGWFVWVGESEISVKWTESLTLPAAGEWPDAADEPNISISPDQRTAIVQDEAVPERGFIFNFWEVAQGDPSGEYAIVVKVADGREEHFSFTLTPPASSDRPAANTFAAAVQACKQIQATAEIPIGCSVEYIEGAPAMVVGFGSLDDATNYWDVMAEHVAEPFCEAANSANRAAFVFVVILDKAARPFLCELDEWGDWFDLESEDVEL
jgi:hypothetical protein